MKSITCRDLGGPCDYSIIAESKDELIRKETDHIKMTIDLPHMKIFEDMLEATDEEKNEWFDFISEKWDEANELE